MIYRMYISNAEILVQESKVEEMQRKGWKLTPPKPEKPKRKKKAEKQETESTE